MGDLRGSPLAHLIHRFFIQLNCSLRGSPREGPDWVIHLLKCLRANNFHKEVDFVVCHL